MKTKYTRLFEPVTIRGVTFKNRILSSPIGVWALIPEDGLSESWLRYLSERAAGGASTVGMGDTQVNCCEPDCEAMGKVLQLRGPNVPWAYLSEFADIIHQHGSIATIELAHCGAGGLSADGKGTYGPVATKSPFGMGHAMDTAKIHETIRQFAECAGNLKRAGFKMVTIHGGHGKLIDQFFQPTNTRSDEYGGSLENRMRFCIEVVDAVRAAVGEDFVIELRVSGLTPEDNAERFEELATLVRALKGKVDIINTSHEPPHDPDSDGPPMVGSDGSTSMPGYLLPPAPNAKYAAALKKAVGDGIYIGAVGAIITPEIAEELLENGSADFVIMGRPLIADPEFPKKARRNAAEDIRPCIGCLKCLNGMHEKHTMRCSVNPRLGKEYYSAPDARAAVPKKVAVIGGGIAGMQAALTCAQRGHSVTLYERTTALGGIFKSFEGDDVKYRLNMLRNWYIRQIGKAGVDVRLNTEATLELLLRDEPDAVILASGSKPIVPRIDGIDGKNVMHVLEAIEKLDTLPHSVAIIGGNLAGCEFAVALLRSGREAAIIEMAPRLHMGGGMDIDWHIKKARKEVNARCTGITEKGVVFERDGTETLVEADLVVYAVGMRAEDSLANQLREEFADFWQVGDCHRVATVYEGIREAYYAALDI